MEIIVTETVQKLIKIDLEFKVAEAKWKISRTGKEKSQNWIEMHRLDGIRSELLTKRQKEIEDDLNSPVELSDGNTLSKRVFMNYQKQYELDDDELKSYLPLIMDKYPDIF